MDRICSCSTILDWHTARGSWVAVESVCTSSQLPAASSTILITRVSRSLLFFSRLLAKLLLRGGRKTAPTIASPTEANIWLTVAQKRKVKRKPISIYHWKVPCRRRPQRNQTTLFLSLYLRQSELRRNKQGKVLLNKAGRSLITTVRTYFELFRSSSKKTWLLQDFETQ